MKDGHLPVRRNGIHVVGLDHHPVLCFNNRDGAVPLEDLGKHACMARVEMGDKDEGHAAVCRDTPEEELEGLEAPG